MLTIKVYGVKEFETLFIEKLNQKMDTLPIIEASVVLTIIHSRTTDAKGNQRPYLEISGSLEMNLDDIIKIANHFIDLIDVEASSPITGLKAFRKRNEFFPEHAFSRAIKVYG